MSRGNPTDRTGESRLIDTQKLGRRSFLTAIGATAVAGGLSGSGSSAPSSTTTYTVSQGDTEFEVTPLSGDVPAEELYDLRFPDQYEGDGVNGTQTPWYQSVGTQDLQEESTTIMFLYDGPNGLSLVVVHDMDGGDGGSATWTVTDLPADSEWVVKDDLYVDAETGEKAGTNYDRWNTDGTDHRIDWTWGAGGTDGGVLRPLGNSFDFTIDPAYNEQSNLWNEYYSGDIEDWQFLSGSRSNPDRTSLSLTDPVTVSAETQQPEPESTYTVQQGDTEFEVTPLSGDTPAEELYDLRLPEQFDGENGATDPGSGPYYQSVGTQGLQEESTTIMFLYHGPNGLSLVVVHDTGGGDGGSATWTVTGLPQDSEWVVKDDLYLDPDTGEPASTNYDRWDTDGTDQTIDWTWGAGGTDGGVARPLGSSFTVTIDPAYNEQATLWEQYYSGDIEDWQFLSGSRSNPDRTSLSLSEPVTISAETPQPDPEPTYTLQQGDTTVELQAVQGSEPIEDRYALQIPDRFEGTAGATDDGGPYYTAVGLTDAQRQDETVMFLYDGPNGLSLVVLHDRTDGSNSGGSVTWSISGLPQDGAWVIKDDYYLDPDTAEPAASNYDRWSTDGTTQTIDWTWGANRTDGGAFRDLGDSFSFTIDPAYNNQAALYDEYYEGDVSGWRVFSGSLENPETTSLTLDAPVTITTGEPSEMPFSVSTVDSSVSGSAVTFRGRLDGLGVIDSATVYVKFWQAGRKESTTYWWTGDNQTAAGIFSTELDLDSGTTYRFRALAQGDDGTWKTGSVQEVTTTGQRFEVETNGASDVSENGATLNGTLTGIGDASSATVYFEYWVDGQRDSSYWWTGDSRSDAGAFSATVDFSSGTTYQYRALAQTNAGRWRAGEVSEFTTGGTAFGVETNQPTVSDSSVTLNGTLTGLGDANSATVYFTYWQANQRASTLQWYTGQMRSDTGTFSSSLDLDNGTYRFQALAQDSTGTWKVGQEKEFVISSAV